MTEQRATGSGDENDQEQQAQQQAQNRPAATSPQAGSSAGQETSATPPAPSPGQSDPASAVEIDLLTYSIVCRLAKGVAQACRSGEDALAAGTGIIVATPSDAATILAARWLQDLLNYQLSRLETVLGRKSGQEAAALLPSIAGLLGQVPDIVDKVAAAVDKLAVTETVSSRAVTVDERTMAEILAGELLKAGLSPIVAGAARAMQPEIVHRLVAASERLRATPDASEEAKAVLAQTDRIVGLLLQGDAPLAKGFGLNSLIGSMPGTLLLAARVVAAGGSSWVRSHLLTRLGFVDPLSLSAGAAVVFSLIDPQTGQLKKGDLIYDWSGRVRLDREKRLAELSNLSGFLQRSGRTAAADRR